MNTYLIPTDDDFVEHIAKVIARNRLSLDISSVMEDITDSTDIPQNTIENEFDRIFERLWAGTTVGDERQKALYRNDALAAIRAINLKLLTSP